jgi:hypothetical protein
MGIGGGIFLIAVGAILTFAVHYQVNGIDISTVGVILMIAGAAVALVDAAYFMPRRRRVITTSAAPAYPAATYPTATTTRSTVTTRDDVY